MPVWLPAAVPTLVDPGFFVGLQLWSSSICPPWTLHLTCSDAPYGTACHAVSSVKKVLMRQCLSLLHKQSCTACGIMAFGYGLQLWHSAVL